MSKVWQQIFIERVNEDVIKSLRISSVKATAPASIMATSKVDLRFVSITAFNCFLEINLSLLSLKAEASVKTL